MQCETAPENPSFEICDWTLKPRSYYQDGADGKKLDIITNYEGQSYSITATTNNNYMINLLTVNLGDGTNNLIRECLSAQLRSTEEPTQEQVDAATLKAQQMLDKMGMGDFFIAESSIAVSKYESLPSYSILVKAVPVFEGISGLLGHTGVIYLNPDLTENSSYGPSYAMTEIEFAFNADGDLVRFRMNSPVDVKVVLNDNVATLPAEELFAKAENYISLYDAESLDGITGNNRYTLSWRNDIPEDSIELKVEITDARYGLGRINKADDDDSFYYTPAILFEGTINFCDKNTGEVIDSVTRTLFTINAVDGSII